MIKKSIFFALLLLIMYSIFSSFFAPSWWSATQSTDQENLLKAQLFISQGRHATSNVIVGSSLANRIITDSIPNTFNLAFGGLSIYEGLSLISNLKDPPKAVFIEMNIVFREENKPFTSSLNSPLRNFMWQELKSLRADQEPLTVLGKAGLNSVYAFKNSLRRNSTTAEKPGSFQHSVQDSLTGLSHKMLTDAYLSYYRIPEASRVLNSFDKLKRYVAQLEKRKVKVFFFEMPIDNRLEGLPLPVFVRMQFHRCFPKNSYTYIERPRWIYCDTFDGQHLSETDAKRYTFYLRAHLPVQY